MSKGVPMFAPGKQRIFTAVAYRTIKLRVISTSTKVKDYNADYSRWWLQQRFKARRTSHDQGQPQGLAGRRFRVISVYIQLS